MYGSITLFCQDNIGATVAEDEGGRRWEEVLQAPAHEEEVSCVHPSKLLFIESCGLCSARAFWAVSWACSRCSLGVQAGFFLDKLKTRRFRTSHKSTDTRNKAQHLVGLF